MQSETKTRFNPKTGKEKPLTKAQVSSLARKRRIARSKRAIKIKEAQERRRALKEKQTRLGKDQLLQNAAISQANKTIQHSTDPEEVLEAHAKLSGFGYRLPGTRAQRRAANCSGYHKECGEARQSIFSALKKKFGKVEL